MMPRSMRGVAVRMLTWLVANWIGVSLSVARAETPPGLTVGSDGVILHEGKPFRGIGVNYFDAFQRMLHNSKDATLDRGFQTLAEARIPFVRIMGCGFWPEEQRLYQKDKEEFFRRFDAVMQAAQRHQVGVIPSLFWMTSTVPDLVGEPVDQWGNPESKTHAYLREYVRDVVTRYKDSPVLWAWEFGNEYNLAANLPNAALHRPPVVPVLGTPASRSQRDELTNEQIRTAFAAFGQEVCRYDARRIIATGNSRPRESAWHNWKERNWAPDTPEQFMEILAGSNPDPVNVLTVHAYGDCTAVIRAAAALGRKLGKPLWVGEFGAEGPPEKSRAEFQSLLAAIEEARVPIAALWVYDFTRQAECNVTSTNDRSYQLRALTEANDRLRTAP